jgi:hypothetical protein
MGRRCGTNDDDDAPPGIVVLESNYSLNTATMSAWSRSSIVPSLGEPVSPGQRRGVLHNAS